MVKASFLKEFGETLELTNRWARDFLFQRLISTNVLKHDILTFNLDEVPLGKYTFNFRGAKNVSINRVDDKRQIAGTLAVTLHGNIIIIIIYNNFADSTNLPGKISTLLAKIQFRDCFSISFTKKYWPNTAKSISSFEEIIFSLFMMTKKEEG